MGTFGFIFKKVKKVKVNNKSPKIHQKYSNMFKTKRKNLFGFSNAQVLAQIKRGEEEDLVRRASALAKQEEARLNALRIAPISFNHYQVLFKRGIKPYATFADDCCYQKYLRSRYTLVLLLHGTNTIGGWCVDDLQGGLEALSLDEVISSVRSSIMDLVTSHHQSQQTIIAPPKKITLIGTRCSLKGILPKNIIGDLNKKCLRSMKMY
jgi:hypothetical protein